MPEDEMKPVKVLPIDVVRRVEEYLADKIEYAETDDESTNARILKARSEVARYNICLLRIKEAEKTVKGRLELAVTELDELEKSTQMTAEEQRVQPNLPFGEKPSAPRADYETAMREYEAMWRKQPIGELSPPLKPGKLKALAAVEPPILTLGDMADFSKQHGDWWGKDIKGFGAKGQEQLGVATDRYWAEHQPPAKPKEEVVDVPAIKDPPIRPIGDFENEFPTGYLVNICRPGLLAKLTAGEVCEVSAVTVDNQLYAVTLAPARYPNDVYALRPLYDAEEGVALPEPYGEDQYVGRLVTCDGEGKWIGPRSEMLLVRDAEATEAA